MLMHEDSLEKSSDKDDKGVASNQNERATGVEGGEELDLTNGIEY